MKHPLGMTAFIVLIFFFSQIIGLVIIQHYHPAPGVQEDLPLGLERPEVENPYAGVVFILIAILLGTGLFLLVIKYAPFIWKYWYFLAMFTTLSIGVFAFVSKIVDSQSAAQIVTIAITLPAAFIKTWRPNIYVHNITELFIYGGLAAIFVSMFNIPSAILLLIGISIYDVIAVNQSKHMIKLAKFQIKSKAFAGVFIPYKAPKGAKVKITKKKSEATRGSAILGGGDIGFPLIFAGVVLPHTSFPQIFLIPLFAAAGLSILFALSKQGKFYPAMPFISAGCFLGYGMLLLF